MEISAAHSLLNVKLNSGWTVIEKISKADNSTGSFFSVCYKVEKDGKICFLKAFDFAKFFSIAQPGSSIVDVMNEMLTAFKYERDLSNHCRNKHVTRVAFVTESGEELVPGFAVSIVPYLIFDLADGDVRKFLDFSKKLDYSWRFKSLHDISVGLKQLHQIHVAHQDLKPSNILLFKNVCKLGDLGRSMCRDLDGPYDGLPFAGDYNYAPPEIMYRYFENDWTKRVFSADCYLLGSMVVFYFMGISMSALLKRNIPDSFSWEKWTGSLEEVKPYLINGFEKSLREFEDSITEPLFKQKMLQLVEQLCHPLPEKRGLPRNNLILGEKYSLIPYVTIFDVLKRKAELKIKSS